MSDSLAKIAWEAVVNKKAKNLVFLDLRGISDICDFQIVCSGDSEVHTKAIAEMVDQSCKAKGQVKPASIEGKGSGHWILLDYGSVMVHIFLHQLRDFYALESLWPNSISEPPV